MTVGLAMDCFTQYDVFNNTKCLFFTKVKPRYGYKRRGK